MAKIALKKKTVSESTSLVSEIRHYARQIWLAGLGAYSPPGHRRQRLLQGNW